MSGKEIPVQDIYCAVVVSATDHDFEELYTLDNTHYGRLLLIFRIGDGLETFREYAQQGLKPGYQAKTMMVIAHTLEDVRAEFDKRGLLPGGPSRVAVEGTPFFDEVLAQLVTDTLWA